MQLLLIVIFTETDMDIEHCYPTYTDIYTDSDPGINTDCDPNAEELC